MVSIAGSSCQAMDLVVVLPTPQNDSNYKTLQTFIKAVLNQIDIGGPSSTVQVGAVTYRGLYVGRLVVNSYMALCLFNQ